MSRLTNDIDAINQAVSQNVTALLASVLSLIGIVVAMFVLNPWLALATLIIVPVIYFFTNFIATYTRRGFRRLQKQLGGLNSVVEETISGQKVIKAFRRSQPVTELFREHNQAVYEAGVYANTYAMMLMPLSSVLGNFFVIILASFGGYLALQGLVTVGTIATFIFYGKNFIGPLQQLANMFNTIQAALAGAERVFEIIDAPPETPDPPDALALAAMAGHVRFEHVSFGYQPGQLVIKDMSLEARAGQTIALVGPTGRRQDHHYQPADALLRDPVRAHHHRRQGHPPGAQGRPAPQPGHRAAGHLPVRRYRHGEHPLRAAGRHATKR
jgi:ATP-binding cassette, subfamily B, multidrug efflux pump